MTVQLIWFKKDLRITDHAPLYEATLRGDCICLYTYEPDIYLSEEFDPSHLQFVNESLVELDNQLQAIGGRLTFRVGHMPDVLESLHQQHPIEALWSHQETGNHTSYMRDICVGKWAKERGIPWHEFPQTGVVRGLKNRDGWSGMWEHRMLQPIVAAPGRIQIPTGIDHELIRHPIDLGLPESTKNEAKIGGESKAWKELTSFLDHRSVNYRADMSSPVTASTGCSRLSPYLAWGNISIKQVYQTTLSRMAQLKELKRSGVEIDSRWLPSLSAFVGRLHWHCHFMQKLEDQPSLEFENMSRAYDGLRENDFNPEYFEAWCNGQTGYPMVDACMRSLLQGGWINFRMRAMLVSFASYHLWLHWRPTAIYLARHWLDFEPGIHFCQFQMQSGTTGINAVRIYSPIKQVTDQDPEGVFIRRYLPSLANIPNEYLAEPHKMPVALQNQVGCMIGKDYPAPIVEHKTAVAQAKKRIYAVRQQSETKNEAKAVYRKHGSRRQTSNRQRGTTNK